jgi:ABC-type glutathione transport system ATPase component
MTFVFSTHDPLVVSYASRVVTLRDGKIVSDIRKDSGSEAPGEGVEGRREGPEAPGDGTEVN